MKIVATNRKARHDYEIIEKLVAGISLSGAEVKSTKAGHVDLKGSYVTFSETKAELVGAHINPYKFSAQEADYSPTRSRRLLLHKKELTTLLDRTRSEHLTVVPLAIGVERGLLKVEIALARGKQAYDKRESKKKQAMARDAQLETGKKA